MRKFFGTDGIRGEANKPPIDVKTAMRVGQAIATPKIRELAVYAAP